jgi:hypothetical protein
MAGGGGAMSALLPTILGALSKRTQDGASATPGAGAAADNQGADDQMILRQLNQVHQALGLVFVRTFQNRPNVANQVSATMKQLSRAIKEAQQASSTSEAVDQNEAAKQPINFSAATAGTGQPDQPQIG